MSLKYQNLSDLAVDYNSRLNHHTINESFQKLLVNDKMMANSIFGTPTIWENKWYNNSSIEGYSKGQAVWLNTEDLSTFLEEKKNDIYDYVIDDPILCQLDILSDYEPDKPLSSDSRFLEFFADILTGYSGKNTTMPLNSPKPPLFEIGNLSADVQIKISQRDNNRSFLSNTADWKDYFKYDVDYADKFNEISAMMMSSHIAEYHASCDFGDISKYASNTLSDVTKTQHVEIHNCDVHNDGQQGFDYMSASTTSSYENIVQEVQTIENQTTKSNYIQYILTAEQEQYYKLRNTMTYAEAEAMLSDVKNFADISQFEGILTGNNSLGNVTLRDVSASSYDGFPTLFKYDKDLIQQLEDSGRSLSCYKVSFVISPLTAESVSGLQTSYYYDLVDKYPAETAEYSQVSAFMDKYQTSSTSDVSSATTKTTYKYNLVSSWVNYWKSGYVEQGGTIFIDDVFEPTILSVKFEQPFSYAESTNSYYGVYDYIINKTLKYDQTGNLRSYDRYTLNICPIAESYDFDNIEIVSMKNDGFQIAVGMNTPNYMTYRAIGTISR